MSKELITLLEKEGWEIGRNNGVYTVKAYGELFPLAHPFAIYGKLFRKEKNPELKFTFMHRMHDLLWPDDIITWNAWSEKRYRTYCEGWRIISQASGASTGKSVDAAKVALIEWLSDPKGTAVIVASTTIESLSSRVYGYLTRYLKDARVPIHYNLIRSAPPKILFDRDDIIHSISAIAAAKGKDESAIANYIGRHPKRKLLLVLDEGPDLDPVILNALPNLEAGQNNFQCIVLGNSNSKFDLHGALSTPKNGWSSIDPMVDTQWETTQSRGICLYFNAYHSPAIYETNPDKKRALSKFLPTAEDIESKKQTMGERSDSFWRFVLGFWKSTSTDDTVISKEFLENFRPGDRAEWSGLHPLSVVAGLDPAFSTGGDKCILRLAILGQTTSGQIVLDYRGDELLFPIPISAHSEKSAELQIADRVIDILKQYNCEIHHLCIDANGQGRALGEVIALRARAFRPPVKIYSTRGGNQAVRSFDVVVKTNHELWFILREYLQHGQIKGLDAEAMRQFTSRLVKVKGGKQLLESKVEYKVRMSAVSSSMAHSPDEADAASLALQSAIINFGFTPGQRKDVESVTGFLHEKLWVFQQTRLVEERAKEKLGPPIADFMGDASDSKFGLPD